MQQATEQGTYVFTVRFRDSETGITHEYCDTYTKCDDRADAVQGVLWQWLHGNYSCDCNRGNFADVDEDVPCGESRFELLTITAPDGGQVYPQL
jgi:hypothetical protein